MLKISQAFQNVIYTQKGILLSLQKEGTMIGGEDKLLAFSHALVTSHGKHMASSHLFVPFWADEATDVVIQINLTGPWFGMS